MDFGVLPPEVNSARMYAGPGAGPMLAAAAAWDGLAMDLQSAATSYQSVISGLTSGPWLGPASVSMAAAAAPYVTWMTTTATQAEQTATQAKTAVAAYEAAYAMTVPPPVIAANRAQLAALVATNILGQNTPAIMANEAHYAEMWAQDTAAMYGYAGSSAAASMLSPFTPAPHTTNPAGLTAHAAAITHAGGTAAASHAQHALSMSTVPQALQGLSQPVQSTSPTAGVGQMVMGTGTSAATSAASTPASALTGLTGATGKGAIKGAGKSVGAGANAAAPLAAALPAAAGGGELGLAEDTLGLGMDGVGLVGLDGGGVGLDLIGVGLDFLGADELTESGGLGPLGSLGGLGGLGAGLGNVGGIGGAGASASIGQAASLGGLSVPQSWAGAAAPLGSFSPASATPLPGSNISAAPAVSSGPSGMPRLTFPSLGGREAEGAITKIGFRSSVVPHSPMAG